VYGGEPSKHTEGRKFLDRASNDLSKEVLLHGIVTNLSSTQATELFSLSLIYNMASYMSF
jgi:hypothetical protein